MAFLLINQEMREKNTECTTKIYFGPFDEALFRDIANRKRTIIRGPLSVCNQCYDLSDMSSWYLRTESILLINSSICGATSFS